MRCHATALHYGLRTLYDYDTHNTSPRTTMKKLLAALSLSLLALGAKAAPPTDASIERLLEVLQAKKLMDEKAKQVQAEIAPKLQSMVEGKSVSPEKRKALDALGARYTEKMIALVAEGLSWKNLQGALSQIYREVYTQDEVDGLITFYESPVGKSYVEKMPVALQKSVNLVQAKMLPAASKIEIIAQELLAEVQAIQAKK